MAFGTSYRCLHINWIIRTDKEKIHQNIWFISSNAILLRINEGLCKNVNLYEKLAWQMVYDMSVSCFKCDAIWVFTDVILLCAKGH